MILGMNIFVAFFLLLLLLADLVPSASNEIPVIGNLILLNFSPLRHENFLRNILLC